MSVTFYVHEKFVTPLLSLVVISLFHLTGDSVGSLLIPGNRSMYVGETENDSELQDTLKSLEGSST